MLEELKQILGIVKDLPHLVMWVLAGLLIYKIAVIGSVFGVIKLAITKFHDYLTTEKKLTYNFRGILIDDHTERELFKFLNETVSKSNSYIHASDIRRLILAWDAAEKATK